MTTVWWPADITDICLRENAPLTQCTLTGYMFLSLVTQLFGGVSYSTSYTGSVAYPNEIPNPAPEPAPPVTSLPSIPISQSFSTSSEMPNLSGWPITYQTPGNEPVPGWPTMMDKTLRTPIEDTDDYLNKPLLPQRPPGYQYYPEYQDRETIYRGFTKIKPVQSGYFRRKSAKDNITASSNENNNSNTSKNRQESRSFRNQQGSRNFREYDFIIVGGGSAGCVLANRLSAVKHWRILLLEAGPEEPDITMVPAFPTTLSRSSIDWNYYTQPEKLTCRGYRNNRCSWPRGRTMGGSSAINYMVYMRGHKLDYDGWAAMGNTGWSYDEILPYFKKAENNRNEEAFDRTHHGVGGPLNVERFPYTDVNTLAIIEAFKEKGLPQKDLTLPDNLGTNLIQSTSMGGRRFSANLAYIRPIRNIRPNLNIIVNTFVTKILIDPITKQAQGVTYYKNHQFHNVYSTKEIIVSGGAINSPKLLMLSGVGPKRHLQNLNIPVIADLNVGENLQEHATSDGLTISLANTSSEVNITQLLNEILLYRSQNENSGPLSTTSTLNAVAFIKTRYAQENAPDIQYHFDARNVEDYYADPENYPVTTIFPLSFYNGLGARPLLLTPRSRGRILLNSTNPIFDDPLIYPGFFTVQEDVHALVEGFRFVVSLENTNAFKRIGATFVKKPVKGCESHIWGSYDYFACILYRYTGIIFHPSGTCKMGPGSDKTAVVDPRLRVYGVKYLRIVDASIMPTVVRGNTNAPVIMIAEKAADLVIEDWVKGN